MATTATVAPTAAAVLSLAPPLAGALLAFNVVAFNVVTFNVVTVDGVGVGTITSKKKRSIFALIVNI